MVIAIAGASGFIGSKLVSKLEASPEIQKVIALARLPKTSSDRVTWKVCDLFSVLQLDEALKGVDIGIYLVHSMLPTAKLNQARFEDSDLLLADHFARMAKKNGLKRIIYLGGLVPNGKTSRHLQSRKETEQVLASTGIPVTTLRAGLVIGRSGSSFQMLYLLVKRLPVLVCPAWTKSQTQCISEEDIIALITFCIFDERTTGQTLDVGTDDIITYRNLMERTAHSLGLRRIFLSVPFFSPGLSRLWVTLITGGSSNLVGPLVQSLKHSMLVEDRRLMQWFEKPLTPLNEALKNSSVGIKPILRSNTRDRSMALKKVNHVRSIQRFDLPKGQSAKSISKLYFDWLPRFLKPLIKIKSTDNRVWEFYFLGLGSPLLGLKLSDQAQNEDRTVYYITHGLLVAKDQSQKSRLEFLEVLNRKHLIIAIHDFKPALPWQIYIGTQAILHLWVMKTFEKYLIANCEAV